VDDGTRPTDPWRKVTKAVARGGGSIFAPIKFHWWYLTLECGHEVERRIRWLPIENAPKGWAALHRGVSLDRLPPDPKRARCSECGRA
jgi:hypothetical protein